MQPGEWESPLHAADVAKAGVTASWPSIVGDDIWWLETRPEEGGRRVIVSEKHGDLITAPWSASTSVHEYGGRSYLGIPTSSGYTIYFANKSDQRLYRASESQTPVALTPESNREFRYAELTQVGDEIWCVRERVTQESTTREIVAISERGEIRTLVSGHQFYMSLRVSPDAQHLSWISWEHPQMPWDGTELFVADIENGAISQKRILAGSKTNPVLSPEWIDSTTLLYIDEESGWWNPWKVSLDGKKTQIINEKSEWGYPAWQLGYVGVAMLDEGKFIALHGPVDERKVALVDLNSSTYRDFATDYTAFVPSFSTDRKKVVIFGANSKSFSTLVELDPTSLKVSRVIRPNPLPIPSTFAPKIEEISIPGRGREVKVILHQPQHPTEKVSGPTPVLVQLHGGPTAHSSAVVKLDYLYWTSRGFTIADINYGGSTGYGSSYRHLLDGQWGVIDYEDVITTVEYLKKEGIADGDKVFIEGGSAGGFTVLNALVHSDVFAAGADYFGVAELSMLATDTHDFESRYLDSMIGPYPHRKDLYDQRSPLTHAEKLNTPLIIFQGTDDKVVPPSQSEAFRDVCARKGIKHKYFAFEGEGHGFVKAESIITSLEESLIFFGEAGGFSPKL
jgi:dipeptidyl aminopeptidase/acylaminoacyl peptidase